MKLEIKYLSPGLLKPNPWNSNKQSHDDEIKLENSISKLDFFKPIIVRQLDDDSLQILGGEHRYRMAVKKKIEEIPVVNLGKLSDEDAKYVGLIDNLRYGTDDSIMLAEVLGDLDMDELLKITSYSESDISSIFSSIDIDLGDLHLDEKENETPILPTTPIAQTAVLQRYKVPVEDSAMIEKVIEKIMKREGYTSEDSLSNAGHALVFLCDKFKQEA